MMQRILRLPQVREKTGLSRSSIYERMADGTFPVPYAIGPRAVGWLESEIENWLSNLVEAGRKAA